jgi:hypothetical protein
MFLKEENFLILEKKAPLLDLNNNYLNKQPRSEIFNRAAEWIAKLPATDRSIFELTDKSSRSARIIRHDAERTFMGT